MKRLFLLIALVVFVLRIDAQNRVGTFSIIPRVGVCIANMTGQDYYKVSLLDGVPEHKISSKYNSDFIVGVDAQYQILDKVAISLGAFYTRQGCKYTDDAEEYPQEENVTWVELIENAYKDVDYLNIPLVAHLYVAKGFSVNTGIQLGILTSAHYKYEQTSFTEITNKETNEKTINFDKNKEGELLNHYKVNQNVKNTLKNLSVSIPVGVSYEYQNVVLDARYNIDLGNYATTDISEKVKNKAFFFTVGYKFDL